MSRYYDGRDETVTELLRAQRPPPQWVVFMVQRYRAHPFNGFDHNVMWDHCRECGLRVDAHKNQDMRIVVILNNGPVRHLTLLTRDLDELPKNARSWLNTLYNLAEAAGTRLDGWIAYDGRG